MTVFQRWWRWLLEWSGALQTSDELARVQWAFRDQQAALEHARTSMEQLRRDAERQREARDQAEAFASEMQSTISRLVAELATARSALVQHPGAAAQLLDARPRAEHAERDVEPVLQRAEVAERDAATLRELNARLIEELEELRSEIEHVRAESMRAGGVPSMRTASLSPAAPGSARPQAAASDAGPRQHERHTRASEPYRRQ